MKKENNFGPVKREFDNQRPDGKKRLSNGWIFGINFLVFIAYTILFVEELGISDGFPEWGLVLLTHVLITVVLAIILKRWAWAIAGLIIFLIGESVCAATTFGLFRN